MKAEVYTEDGPGAFWRRSSRESSWKDGCWKGPPEADARDMGGGIGITRVE